MTGFELNSTIPFHLGDRDFAAYLQEGTDPLKTLKEGVRWFEKNKKPTAEGLGVVEVLLNNVQNAVRLPDVSGITNPSYTLDQSEFAKALNKMFNARTALAMGFEWFKRNGGEYGKNLELTISVFNKLKIALNELG